MFVFKRGLISKRMYSINNTQSLHQYYSTLFISLHHNAFQSYRNFKQTRGTTASQLTRWICYRYNASFVLSRKFRSGCKNVFASHMILLLKNNGQLVALCWIITDFLFQCNRGAFALKHISTSLKSTNFEFKK